MNFETKQIEEVNLYFNELFKQQLKDKEDINEINEKINEKLKFIGFKLNYEEFGNDLIEKYNIVITKLLIFIASKMHFYVDLLSDDDFNFLVKNIDFLNEVLLKKTYLMSKEFFNMGLIITKKLDDGTYEVVPVKNPTLEQKKIFSKYKISGNILIQNIK